MTAPQTTKSWTITPNLRRVYTSLTDELGFWAYRNKVAMLASSWTMKWSSDGTNSPSGPGDNADWIVNEAAFATQVASPGTAPHSWYLLQNPDGVQVLISYIGASGSIAQVGFSTNGLYTLASPTTHKPTATDEIIIHGARSVVGTGTDDRLVHIWCAADGTAWRCVVFGTSTLRSCIHVDKVTRIAPASTFPKPYLGGTFGRLSRQVNQTDTPGLCPVQFGGAGFQNPGAAGAYGWYGRVFTAAVDRTCRMVGQPYLGSYASTLSTPEYSTMEAAKTTSTYAASLGGTGAVCWPLNTVGEPTVNLDGPWATLIDWYQVPTTTPSTPAVTDQMPGYEVGDTPEVSPVSPRTAWWMSLGSAALWPWKNVAAIMEIV